LPGPPEIEKVVLGEDGILEGACAGRVLIDLSTNYPPKIRQIAALALEKGVTVLDAPVTGGTFGAEAGTLTIMVGGQLEAFQRSEEILAVLGKQIMHVGKVGDATAVKLIHNLLAEIQLFGIAESMALAAKAGLDLNTLFDVLSSSFVSSGILTQKYMKCGFKGNFEPAFAIDLACKDQMLVMQLAKNHDVPLHLGSIILEKLLEAKALGLGNKDVTAILLPLEKLHHITIRL
jgi:3-hydroxyisobutyrate dehydrogenase-like beta-hydroxyacid dehydrogenase